VEWPFTEIFGCCPAAARQLGGRTSILPCPTQAPLPCAINKIQDKGSDRQNHEYACKQHQGRQHLLDKIHLQSNKGHEPKPHPLAGFIFTKFFSKTLTDSHWDESFPVTLFLDAIHHALDALSIGTPGSGYWYGTGARISLGLSVQDYYY
jgi:hypothetical protein